MKNNIFFLLLLAGTLILSSCSVPQQPETRLAYRFYNINKGWFTDAGSRYGFTIPQQDKWVNGFCGPFHLGKQQWLSDALLKVNFADEDKYATYIPDSASYFPGELYIAASSAKGQVIQQLIFIDKSTALFSCHSSSNNCFHFYGEVLPKDVSCAIDKNRLLLTWPDGEGIALTFSPDAGILIHENCYEVLSILQGEAHVVISFFDNKLSQLPALQKAMNVLASPEEYKRQTADRWENYLRSVLRDDMPEEYNRIAVKAVVSRMSNLNDYETD